MNDFVSRSRLARGKPTADVRRWTIVGKVLGVELVVARRDSQEEILDRLDALREAGHYRDLRVLAPAEEK